MVISHRFCTQVIKTILLDRSTHPLWIKADGLRLAQAKMIVQH